MNTKRLIYFFSLLLVFCSFSAKKKFPVFSYESIDGTKITNDYFVGKTTLVIMGHLGCPGLMYAINDIEGWDNNGQFQTLLILENTPSQVQQFNSDSKSDWNDIRTFFKTQPLKGVVISECETENISTDKDGNTIIGLQCRKLSKKIHTKSSPTFVLVDGDGTIKSKISGYSDSKDIEVRRRSLLKRIGID